MSRMLPVTIVALRLVHAGGTTASAITTDGCQD